MSPLRCIHIIEKNRLITGSVVQMVEAAAGLAKRGHQIAVVGRPGGDLETFCAFKDLEFTSLPLAHPFDVASAVHLRRLLRRRRPHVVHAHKGRSHAVALLAATGLGRNPAVVVNRGVSFPLDRFNRWKYHHPRVRAVVCVAEAVRHTAIVSGRLDPERVHTIHSGTDTSRFDPQVISRDAVRHELGLADRHLMVAQVSVREWKGWRDLLAACASLFKESHDLRLLFVGCEPESARYEVLEAARRAGVAEMVLTLPFRDDMPEVLAACDVVADASTGGTGITGTIREAMAMERAVVATDCGGNRELVEHGVSGILVPPGDVDEIKRAIAGPLEDRDARAGLGRAGRRRVLEHFSSDRRLDRLEALYFECRNMRA